jgi:hypothetical protein
MNTTENHHELRQHNIRTRYADFGISSNQCYRHGYFNLLSKEIPMNTLLELWWYSTIYANAIIT